MVQTLPKLGINYLEIPDNLLLQVTPEQFAILAIVNRDLRLERTATGELIVTPPAGGESGKRNLNLTGQLHSWYEKHEELGEAFDSSTGFTLPNGAILSPDASWVARDRWDALTKNEQIGFVPLCPDFVVELRSSSDSLPTLKKKMQEYMDNGATLGWLIDPQNNRVEIYRQNKPVEILESPTTLSGDEVMPGFILDLKRVIR